MTDIRFSADLKRLSLKPGDMLVLTSARPISRAMLEHIQAAWRQFAGPEVKLLILDQGMKLGAINVQPEPSHLDG